MHMKNGKQKTNNILIYKLLKALVKTYEKTNFKYLAYLYMDVCRGY